METNTLRSHFDHMIKCTEGLCLSQHLLERYRGHYEEIFQYCLEKQKEKFLYQDAKDFCSLVCPGRKRYAGKETTKIAYTIADYFTNGCFLWSTITFTQYPLSERNEEIWSSFQTEMLKTLSSGTVRVGMVIVRQFLYSLEIKGKPDVSCVETADVLDFVREEAPNHKNSMSKLLRTIKKFVCFLRNEGIADVDADRFLTTAGRCRQKSLPCFTENELLMILGQIDRSTDQGRRDYAIFLLALRTGLRASDISELKLDDIDWRQKTICIAQKKTGVLLTIPLPTDVGNAIADYIINSRYQTDNPHVFLRLRKAPNKEPIEPTSFNHSLRQYMEAAGITRKGWDGRTFHAFRRTAGTSMLTAGTDVTTVAQILGHTSMESTKRYISLDTDRLRECCMDLGAMHTRKEGLI